MDEKNEATTCYSGF